MKRGSEFRALARKRGRLFTTGSRFQLLLSHWGANAVKRGSEFRALARKRGRQFTTGSKL